MNHRPVCTRCQVEFVCVKNGVEVLDYTLVAPYKITAADEWWCPECKFRIIIGFGEPSARNGDEQANKVLEQSISDARYRDTLRHNFVDAITKTNIVAAGTIA